MRRSHTVKTTRSSLPTGPQTTDDLGTLQEIRAPASHNIELLEASLRSEIFEKERENDRLVDQVLGLQMQLTQRPPLSAIQELENEKKTLEIILLGTQRENEKMMTELERQKKRERALEAELRRLCGDNWQIMLNIPTSADAPHPSPGLTPSARGIFTVSSIAGNGNYSVSSLSLHNPNTLPRRLNNVLPSSVTGRPIDSDVSSSVQIDGRDDGSTETDLSRDDADGDGDIDSGPEERPQRRQSRRPTEREIALEHANELLKKQIEQVRLLVLGMDERLVGREDRLAKAIQRAEQENKDLEAKLRELDLNAPSTK